ncbi:hypothetical protein [Microbulbifer magnicolonia]|uniref:carboxymuconolactone decarboxylase family protein n=1 Tax=Microbulbifer magnicolonia TaxID=3109744 RepID=UPI002B4076E1|nr:hypothetical protein [Microbulbifer sp. GG15]
MSRIPLVDTPAEDRALQLFAEIKDQLGAVPSLFRAYAQHVALLEANWHKFKALMIHGCLSPQLKEGMGLVISADNHCDYGIYHHSVTLQNLGVDPKEVMRIRVDPKHIHFSAKEQALFDLARHANSSPDDHGERLIAAARKLGARDDEIVEALGVSELVAGFNHTADILGLDPQRDREE